jgi:hypothetical protein
MDAQSGDIFPTLRKAGHRCPVDEISFAASAALAPVPSLVPGRYPRAWPVEEFTLPDGSSQFAVALDGVWNLIPETALQHAAFEVGVSSDAVITTANYARGVALLVTALRKCGWVVEAPIASRSNPDRHSRGA